MTRLAAQHDLLDTPESSPFSPCSTLAYAAESSLDRLRRHSCQLIGPASFATAFASC
jgi:hypothetical protein